MKYKNEFEQMLDRATMRLGDVLLIIVILGASVMIIRTIASLC